MLSSPSDFDLGHFCGKIRFTNFFLAGQTSQTLGSTIETQSLAKNAPKCLPGECAAGKEAEKMLGFPLSFWPAGERTRCALRKQQSLNSSAETAGGAAGSAGRAGSGGHGGGTGTAGTAAAGTAEEPGRPGARAGDNLTTCPSPANEGSRGLGAASAALRGSTESLLLLLGMTMVRDGEGTALGSTPSSTAFLGDGNPDTCEKRQR